MKINLIFTVFSILVLSLNAEASSKKFKVLFVVPPTADAVLASETRSYISRELRTLQDVEQIGKDPNSDNYLISLYPISIKLSNGQSAGFAISYVFEKDSEIEHNVLTGAPNELKTLCEKVIAHFDTYWLEPSRKKHK